MSAVTLFSETRPRTKITDVLLDLTDFRRDSPCSSFIEVLRCLSILELVRNRFQILSFSVVILKSCRRLASWIVLTQRWAQRSPGGSASATNSAILPLLPFFVETTTLHHCSWHASTTDVDAIDENLIIVHRRLGAGNQHLTPLPIITAVLVVAKCRHHRQLSSVTVIAARREQQ